MLSARSTNPLAGSIDMQRFEELIPPFDVVREQYAANLREARMLRRLIKLTRDANRSVEEHRRIFGQSQPSRETVVSS